MYARRRVRANDYPMPQLLYFRGTTNAKGIVPLDLKRESMFSEHDEIAVTDIFMDVSRVKNVHEGRHFVSGIDRTSQGLPSWDVKSLPASRVVTVEDLATVIEGTLVGMRFSYTNDQNLVLEGSPGWTYKLTETLARCLGFLTASGEVSALIQHMNKGNVDLWFRPSEQKGDARELHIRVLQNGNGKCQLLTGRGRNIWNYVSEKSIQTLFLYCNLLEPTLVGSGYFRHLLNMNFPETADIVSRAFGRDDAIWQRVKRAITTLPELTVADGQGNVIPDVIISCNLAVRRRPYT